MGNQQAKKQQQQKLKKQKLQKQLQQLQQKQKLIGTAVLFLEGQKVKAIPQTQKRIFLLKKGLTDEMITEAYKRLKEKQQVKQQVNPSSEVQVLVVGQKQKQEDKNGKDQK